MSEGPLAPRPLLHPVLTLRTKPAKKGAPGGSKKEKDVVVSRLAEQRRFLASRVRQIRGGTHPRFGSHMLLVVEMFPDSQATSKTPRDLFNGLYGATFLRGAAVDGYLAEVTDEDLLTLETRIAKGESMIFRELKTSGRLRRVMSCADGPCPACGATLQKSTADVRSSYGFSHSGIRRHEPTS